MSAAKGETTRCIIRYSLRDTGRSRPHSDLGSLGERRQGASSLLSTCETFADRTAYLSTCEVFSSATHLGCSSYSGFNVPRQKLHRRALE